MKFAKTISKNLQNFAGSYLLFIATFLSIISWYLSYTKNLTTTYNDAMAHLNLSRLLIDNLQPGLSQLGGVWLPLNHILPLIFIWNDWAWHSGFAGSFYSMLSYIASVIGIFLVVKTLTQKILPSVLGALIFALNLNILYLQTTPLTEPLYLLFFIYSALFFVKWLKEEEVLYLIGIGFFGFLQVMTRYDGWFVAIIAIGLLLGHELFNKKETFSSAFGKLTFAILPILFGITLWLMWNFLIFGNPLFFAIGPYSAHAQQAAIEKNAGLITYHNIAYSLLAYFYAIKDNVGIYISTLAVIGLLPFLLVKNKSLSVNKKVLVILFLSLPIIFNIFSLFMGFSILNLPELKWNPSPNPSGQWFNVRYGILALPMAAVFAGILASWKKILGLLVIALIFVQLFFTYQAGIITVIDGTEGSSSFVNNDVAQKLQQIATPSDKILIATSFFSPVDFKSGIDLHQVIHEGVSKEWQYALLGPQHYATLIVMANYNVGDPVYTALVTQENGRFLRYYHLAYAGKHANIYQLNTPSQFVTKNGNQLTLSGTQFKATGVNSYDLAYRTNAEIENTMQQMQSIGVTTVRFWAFGDGNSNGFQPNAGQYNESRFVKMDYILQQAKKYNIKVIPTLVNNWKDYGGKPQYLAWAGLSSTPSDAFYTNDKIATLFKAYITTVITRKNTLTGVTYAQDPTILAWDIMNEPTVTTIKDQTNLNIWTNNMAQYIKKLDLNHLVLIGTQKADKNFNDQGGSLCSLTIDICSVHLYLYVNNQIQYADINQVNQFLLSQKTVANTFNKPIIIEEFGISKKTQPFNQNPLLVMKNIVQETTKLNYNGVIIWNWQNKQDTSFGFTPSGTATGTYSLADLQTILSQ